jgi:hypothetical protein
MSGASAAPAPMPPGRPIAVPVESSTWDRITNWASENKAIVYTIAGVTLVATGAGVVYYLNSDSVRTILWGEQPHLPNPMLYRTTHHPIHKPDN